MTPKTFYKNAETLGNLNIANDHDVTWLTWYNRKNN